MKRYGIVVYEENDWRGSYAEHNEEIDGEWVRWDDADKLQKNFTLAMILLSNVGSTDGDLSSTFINEINKFIRECQT